jgi:hypothetical protein
MGPRAGMDGREISPPTGFDPGDRPACSQSLYRLSYPDHHYTIEVIEYKEHHPADCLKFAKVFPVENTKVTSFGKLQ